MFHASSRGEVIYVGHHTCQCFESARPKPVTRAMHDRTHSSWFVALFSQMHSYRVACLL